MTNRYRDVAGKLRCRECNGYVIEQERCKKCRNKKQAAREAARKEEERQERLQKEWALSEWWTDENLRRLRAYCRAYVALKGYESKKEFAEAYPIECAKDQPVWYWFNREQWARKCSRRKYGGFLEDMEGRLDELRYWSRRKQ